MPVTLFQYNQTAYQNAVYMMQRQGKAAVIHPTGTGKSFIAFKLAEDNPEARICWLSPSEYIFTIQGENYLKAGGSPEVLGRICFLTYSRLMWNEGLAESLKPDFIILDEFHRCGAAEWGRSTARLLERYPEAKVLGLSATNVRYLDNRRDMAEELFGGSVAARMGLGEAVARGILPAPVYVTALYSWEKELERLRRRTDGLMNPVLKKECAGLLGKLRRCLQQADGPEEIFMRHMDPAGKYLVFCAGKEHMDEMVALAPEWFRKVDPDPHIYRAYYDSGESRRQLEAFCGDRSGSLKLLYCIDMLNEGVHVADVDGVVLLRPTVSPTVYLQQVGRALSCAHGSRPVIFDLVDNFEGLCSVDALGEQAEEAFRALPESLRGQWQGRFQVTEEARDGRLLFEQLQRNLAASWEVYYRELEKYYETHKNILAPKNHVTETGLNLGLWLQRQRSVRKGKTEGVLTESQIARLDHLGMVWDVADSAWEKYCLAAEQYAREHHSLDVPKKYVTEEGLGLGAWITTQRQVRKGTRPGNLSQEKIERLERLGMCWEDAQDRRWAEGYRRLAQYRQERGDVDIPCRYVAEDGYALGSWLYRQRRQRKELTAERVRLLEELGVVWETPSREEEEPAPKSCWERSYCLAQKYYLEHGHLDVPVNCVIEGIRLGRWVSRMRESRRSGARTPLTEEQVKKLDGIGMVWDTPWDVRFRAARSYYESHGDLRVPRDYVTGDRIWLGKWLYRQKRKHGQPGRRGLTESQVQSLESIGMEWK